MVSKPHKSKSKGPRLIRPTKSHGSSTTFCNNRVLRCQLLALHAIVLVVNMRFSPKMFFAFLGESEDTSVQPLIQQSIISSSPHKWKESERPPDSAGVANDTLVKNKLLIPESSSKLHTSSSSSSSFKHKFENIGATTLIPPRTPTEITPEHLAFDTQYDVWIGPPKNRSHNSGDWWRFHVPDDRPDSARKKAEADYDIARKKWFQEHWEIVNKNGTLEATSNKLDSKYCVQSRYHPKTPKEVLWSPPAELLCNWTNTAIFWHSMHGTMAGRDFRNAPQHHQHWMWQFADELNLKVNCSCPDNVAFVFADNNATKSSDDRLVERSYRKCNEVNCHYFHVAQDYHPWDWYGKIGPTLDLIQQEAFQERFDYVVLTDADDQTLVRSPHDIVRKFELYEADLVVGGEATSFPHWQITEKEMENHRYPWSRHHQHINAGGMMGRSKEFVKYLKMAKNDYEQYTIENAEEISKNDGRNQWKDQTWLRRLHLNHYPNIKVDSLALLWSRTDLFLNDL